MWTNPKSLLSSVFLAGVRVCSQSFLGIKSFSFSDLKQLHDKEALSIPSLTNSEHIKPANSYKLEVRHKLIHQGASQRSPPLTHLQLLSITHVSSCVSGGSGFERTASGVSSKPQTVAQSLAVESGWGEHILQRCRAIPQAETAVRGSRQRQRQ